ncbi:hypothetical protein [Pelagicoccus albus]|uniref:Leucine rich repeat variant n=1 Tax=Pelagicoccus albus TaxID=415222 RepID=A0A7X1E742_9BACT|nr:hypothetical protein [Pelagicoccus albus]MBC2604939.1 hypothetical protein [Pelagicoccus albus]
MDILSINALLDALEEFGPAKVIKGTRKRPISSFALRSLYSDYSHKSTYVLFLAQYPLLPSELALEMTEGLKENQAEVAAALAANPRSPQQALQILSKHTDPLVRTAVAQNPNASPKECQILAQDSAPLVRSRIAENPSLPNFLQFILANDEEAAVKVALAGRENLDADVAYQLSCDKSILVKTALLQNKSLDPEMIQMWADQDDEELQQLLIRRFKHFPASVRNSLRYSSHSSVRFPALDASPLSLAEMLWLAESDSIEDRVYLARQSDLPAAIQRILAQDTSEKARRNLAANSNLLLEIGERIATSHDLQACIALAKNPKASPELLNELCLHPDPQVATLVAYREDLSDKHWNLLINQREDNQVAEHIAFQAVEYPEIEASVASRFSHSLNPSLRAFAAAAFQLPAADLARLAQDHCDKVRESVAQNPSLPEAQLRALCYDQNQDIANTAEKAVAIRLQSPHSSTNEPSARQTHASRAPIESRKKILGKILSFFKE